jgi:hypothetical protein
MQDRERRFVSEGFATEASGGTARFIARFLALAVSARS